MKRLTTAVLVCGLAACGSPSGPETTESTTSCSGGKCDSTGFEVIPGGIWASCHIEPGPTVDLLMCQRFADGEVLFADIVTTQARKDNVIVGSGVHREADEHPARIGHDDYPVELEVSVGFPEHKVEGFSRLRYSVTVTVDGAESLGASAPLVIEQPFDIWPMQIATELDTAVFEATFPVADDLELHPALVATSAEVQSLLVGAPRDGAPIVGTLRVSPAFDSFAAELPGPGRYVADASGLRLATDADAHLFGDAPEPTDPIEPDPDPTDPTTPPCTFDYLTWLNEFGGLVSTPEAQAHLDALECKPVGAVEYQAWHALFKQTLQTALPSTTSSLDDEELVTMERILDARPESDAEESYARALAEFDERLAAYMPQATSPIDENEGIVLDLVTRSVPRAVVGDASYGAWFALYDRHFRGFVPQATSPLDPDELAKLDRVAALRPTAGGESAYATWFVLYAEYFDLFVPQSSSPLDTRESAVLDTLARIAPESTSTAGYEAWLTKFTRRFLMTTPTVTDDERNHLSALVTVRPCVADMAAAQAVLDTLGATVSEATDVYGEMATAAACASPESASAEGS